jgi:DNA-binding NarL/FixJ family response regulator
LVKSEKIDLVLMDIDLGKNRIDGIEAAETILLEHDLPIVFCTNHNEKEIVERVKGITRYGYVLKNSGEFVIIEAINTAFELYSLSCIWFEKMILRR